MYGYIFGKATLYLKMKPEIYSKKDALGRPDPDLSEEELNLLRIGCCQIIEGKGKTPDNPLVDIGIHGFYLLIDLFHFKLSMQSIVDSGENGILDRMECIHFVNGEELVLYNLVKKEERTS